MILNILFLFGVFGLALGGLTAFVLDKKAMRGWIIDYLRQSMKSRPQTSGPVHLMFCFVDHYEPQWNNKSDLELERRRVDRWISEYPKMASRFTDADGNHPKHTFFFPAEEYRYEHLAKLSNLCALGFGEIEIHLHHDNDTSDNLKKTLLDFAQTLHNQHGALSVDPATGQPVYAFIHGNWALDNSHPEGRFCGVNDELLVLKETGCYADMTFPSPDATQPAMTNCFFYAKDDPNRPKSYNTGRRMTAGKEPWGDLLIMQGPLGFNRGEFKFGLLPKIERAEIRDNCLATPRRIDNWVDQHIHVAGQPNWIFIKIHTHGAQEAIMEAVLAEPVAAMHEHLVSHYNDGERYRLHYVSAREMYNIAKAAEAGQQGDPNHFRDYIYPRPSFKNN